MPQPAERLRQAAFELFERQGYDATTVDQIAELADVGRTTFFRLFGSKEEVIFPDHTDVVARVRARLATATVESTPTAITEAALLVLRRYLDEGELARSRYRLTRSVPALRSREIALMQQYQQEFREFARGWTGEVPGHDLRAELLASAIVVAHNHVLRRWLRGQTDEPEREFDEALSLVTSLHTPARSTSRSTVLVIESDHGPQEVAAAVRQALGGLAPA